MGVRVSVGVEVGDAGVKVGVRVKVGDVGVKVGVRVGVKVGDVGVKVGVNVAQLPEVRHTASGTKAQFVGHVPWAGASKHEGDAPSH